MKKQIRILTAAVLMAPLLAFGQAAKDAAKGASKGGAREAVAHVNGVAIPKSRLDFLIQQQAARGAPDNEQTRAQVREELVNREVIAQEAAKSPIARNAETQMQLELARQEVMIAAYLREYVRRNPVSDADVQKEYDRAKSQTGDKEYKARHILVDSEDQAKGLIADLRKGGKFDDLASKHTKDTGTKERGGDLDWNVPGVFDKAFSDAMVRLEKGKFTDQPVRTRFGFHVIQLDDVRAVKFPTFAEVKQRIQQQLTQAKVDELVKGLRAKAKVE